MRDTFVIHYMTKALREYLQNVSDKLPLAPMDSVLRNVLDFSQTGGHTTVLQDFCATYLGFIKLLQKTPDSESGLQEVSFSPMLESTDVIVDFGDAEYKPLNASQQQIS